MATSTQNGYFVLADISGYTAYLAGVELDHAHEILTGLLETIIAKFKPLLTISKLEGDAVFAYVPGTRLTRGETLLELVESTYVAFCDRRDASHRRTTCECRACQNIPSLDLKFFVHYGNYIIQNISGASELVGSDVNLAHRLMKNGVHDATGWKAYTLLTEKGLDQLGVRPSDLHQQPEAYEHLGEVQTFSFDLHPRRDALLDARREVVQPNEADYLLTLETPFPPSVVWEWFTDPRKRSRWMTGMHWRMGSRPQGRTGVGAQNHCDHGKTTSTEMILDWRPFEYFTARSGDASMILLETCYLEPSADGSGTILRDVMKFEKFPFPLPRPLAVRLMGFMFNNVLKYNKMFFGLADLIAEDQAALQGADVAAG